MPILELVQDRKKELVKVREQIEELRQEMGVDYCEETRLDYLERRVPELAQFIKDKKLSLTALYTAIGLSQKDMEKTINEEMHSENREYFNLYTALADLKKPITAKPQSGFTSRHIECARMIPIETLLTSRTIINAGGGRKKTHCPFHEERTPSFVIFQNNSYHCFGCSAHGNNAIDYVMQIDGKNFKDAVDYLLQFYAAGISVQ